MKMAMAERLSQAIVLVEADIAAVNASLSSLQAMVLKVTFVLTASSPKCARVFSIVSNCSTNQEA